MPRRLAGALAAVWLLCGAGLARAQEDQAAANPTASPHSGGLWERDVLTGDWGGWRDTLENAGILLGADSIDETLGNPSGGVRAGAIYEERLEGLLTLDLDKLFAWPQATFHANAYEMNGRGLSANDLGDNLLTASNIEELRATRLFDLWVEQLFMGGALSLRVGQIAADDEFFISQYASNFINATFGWPAIMSSDLPSGGPAYPLATPGARLRYAVSNRLSVEAAIFNGNPAGAGSGNPEARDPSGTSFRVNDGAFAILEASYAVNQDTPPTGLPATYKLGIWYHSGNFADEHFDNTGKSLASPSSTGVGAPHSGDYGAYGVIDHMLWLKEGTADQGLAAFLRLGAAPPDRNLVALYGDIGLSVKGPFAGRGDDVAGIAVGAARISQAARALDADEQRLAGSANPVRDGETAIELTYRYQASQWWGLQPDLQFILHPAGGAAAPGNPASPSRIPDAVVLGIRSAIIF